MNTQTPSLDMIAVHSAPCSLPQQEGGMGGMKPLRPIKSFRCYCINDIENEITLKSNVFECNLIHA